MSWRIPKSSVALFLAAAIAVALVPRLVPAQDGPLRALIRQRVDGRALAAAPPAMTLAAGQAIAGPGLYEVHMTHDGLDRVYRVHVPASYDGARPAPLVMALHGGGGGMLYQANDDNYGLITKSEQAGFIAVFPNGISRLASGMLATWNAGNCCAQARDQNVDDVGFLRAVIVDVGRRASVDAHRVFAIGMSNGAMMAYRLACEAPDVFRGIMAVAGTDNTKACKPTRPVPVLHVHARNDDRVLYDGGAGAKFRSSDLVTSFVAVPDSIAKWVKLDRAEPQAHRVLDVPGAYCERHDALRGGAPVELCVTETGGHSWPGARKNFNGAMPSEAIRANDLMWEFFASL
jgi:polyhydroxybutyrate depolymerase